MSIDLPPKRLALSISTFAFDCVSHFIFLRDPTTGTDDDTSSVLLEWSFFGVRCAEYHTYLYYPAHASASFHVLPYSTSLVEFGPASSAHPRPEPALVVLDISTIEMSASLPMKLALFIAVLAGSLTVMLYRVHKATQFQATDPRGELGNLPSDNNDTRRILTDEKSARGTEEAVEEVEEKREPMNILLFYADDWRHDTLGAAGNPVVKMLVLDSLHHKPVQGWY